MTVTCSRNFGVHSLELDLIPLGSWWPLTQLHQCSSAFSLCRQEVEELKLNWACPFCCWGALELYLVIQRICLQRAKCLSKSKLCFKLSPSTLIVCICGFNHLVLSFPLPVTLLTAFPGEAVKNSSVILWGNKTISNCFPLNLSPFLSHCVCTSYWMPVTF